tara:strand:- start:158 stop:943 length:786 start_codon:yes stop_codon:yes gene_type:complete
MHSKVLSENDAVKLSNNLKKGNWIVLYKAEWCGHCQDLKPKWEQFTNQISNKINVAEVESKFIPNMNLNHMISGYPTINMYHNNNHIATYEDSDRSPEKLVEFVKQNMTGRLLSLNNNNSKMNNKSRGKNSSKKHSSKKHSSKKHSSKSKSSKKYSSKNKSSKKHSSKGNSSRNNSSRKHSSRNNSSRNNSSRGNNSSSNNSSSNNSSRNNSSKKHSSKGNNSSKNKKKMVNIKNVQKMISNKISEGYKPNNIVEALQMIK